MSGSFFLRAFFPGGCWYNAPVWKKLFLVIWVAGILFPAAWASQYNPTTAAIFNRVFAQNWVHVLAHSVLYAILGGLIFSLVVPRSQQSPASGGQVLALISITLALGILQEGLQIITAGAPFTHEEFFDLRVDILAGLAGMALVAYWRGKSRSLRAQEMER